MRRRTIQSFKGKSLKGSRLGELLYVRIFVSAFELIDICIIVIIVRFWLNLCVSGKFPETA